jgi:hypothetical protein
VENLPKVPPVPGNPGGRIEEQNDGSYIEFDDNNTPRGEWHWDNDDNEWVFNEYPPPLIDFPATGDPGPGIYAAAAIIMAACVIYLMKKKNKE